MSKAGLGMLLAVAMLLLGAQNINAQEAKSLVTEEKASLCDTLLKSEFSYLQADCKVEKAYQQAKSTSAAEKKPKTISIALEPVKYTPPKVEVTPTTTITIVPSINPTVTMQTPQSGMGDSINNNSDTILELINGHRAKIGKAPFQKDEALCQLAQVRSTELSGEFANGGLHSGLYNRNLPYFITENAKWGSNDAGTVQWWLNSPVHRSAIEGDHVYSCGACVGTKCAQLFTSYTPKQYSVAATANAVTN